MRIESLRYFLEVVSSGSFTQAAKSLYISQQGLSRAISALEEDLGVLLFKRTSKRIILTEEGKETVPYAKLIVDREKDMRVALALHHKPTSQAIDPEICISAMPFATNIIFGLLKDPVERFGLANVTLTERNLEDTVSMLEEGEPSDPALILVPTNEIPCLILSDNLTFTSLFSVDVVAICPKSLISPRRHVLSVQELSELPVAYYNDTTIDRTVKLLTKGQKLKKVALRASSTDVINEAVAKGRACFLTDSFSAYIQEKDNSTVLLSIKPSCSLVFGFLTSEKHPPTYSQKDYIKRFTTMLNEECKSYIVQHPIAELTPRLSDFR